MKIIKLIPIMLVLILAAGCLAPAQLHVNFNPSTVTLKPGDTHIPITIHIRLSGLSTTYLDEIGFFAVDKDGNNLQSYTQSIKQEVPGLGIEFKKEIWIPINYEQAVELNLEKLVVRITGDRESVFELKIIIETEK